MVSSAYRDPEIEMFRGEFTNLNGGADFYADSVAALRQDGETSLRIFLETCREKGIEPTKMYSDKFQVRAWVNAQASDRCRQGPRVSLNQLVAIALEHELPA